MQLFHPILILAAIALTSSCNSAATDRASASGKQGNEASLGSGGNSKTTSLSTTSQVGEGVGEMDSDPTNNGLETFLSPLKLSDVPSDASTGVKTALLENDAIKDKPNGASALRYVPYPESGALLGQGWNSFTNSPVQNECIVFEERIVPGHEISISASEIHSRYQLNKKLKMSMSGSYSGYGVSASAKASYSSSLDVDQNDTNILANVEIWKGDQFVAPARISPSDSDDRPLNAARVLSVSFSQEILDDLKEEETAEGRLAVFRRKCGDSYIAHIRNGASLNAYLTYESLSRAEKQSMAAKISAGGWGAKLSGSVASSDEEKSESKSTNISIYQTGGFLRPTPMNISDFQTTISEFARSEDPDYFPVKPYLIGLGSYSDLPGWSDDLAAMTNPDSLVEVITLYWLYDDLRKNYTHALQYPDKYSIVDLTRTAGPTFTLDYSTYSCTYKVSEKNSSTFRQQPERLSLPREAEMPVFALEPQEQDINCPDGDELDNSVPSDVTQIRKRLAEVVTIQKALRHSIEECRKSGDYQQCSSGAAFEHVTARAEEKFEEVSRLALSAKTFKPSTSIFDLELASNLGTPNGSYSLLDSSKERFSNDTSVEGISLDNLYELMAIIRNEGFDEALAELESELEISRSRLIALKESISNIWPTEGDETATFEQLFRADEEFWGLYEESILGELGLQARPDTPFLSLAIARKVKEAEEEQFLEVARQAGLLQQLSTENGDLAKVFKSYLTRRALLEADFPGIWPFNVTVQALDAKSNPEPTKISEEWEDLVSAFYVYSAALPMKTESLKGGIAVEDPNAAALESSARTRAMRSARLTNLIDLSESFCDEDIIHGLCRSLDDIVTDMNSVNLSTVNKVAQVEGKVHSKRRCRSRGRTWYGRKRKKKCKTYTWQDPTTYVSQIVTGTEVEL